MFKKRFYRTRVFNNDLVTFCVQHYESNLLISAHSKLEHQAAESLRFVHAQIRDFCNRFPLFEKSLKPIEIKPPVPRIIRTMQYASCKSGVGPMATVAGAVAQTVGKKLLAYSDEVIVENGGDIFIATKKKRRIGIFAGPGNVFNELVFMITPSQSPCGICASSGMFGHSLSFGKTNATVIIAKSAALADGYATLIGNMVKTDSDIQLALDAAKQNKDIKGLIVITSSKMASYGNITLDVLDN